jgi:hypothetical protein
MVIAICCAITRGRETDMRPVFSTAAVLGILMAAPWAGLAAPAQAKAAKTTTASKPTAGTHSTTGTVKSVSATALVVARSGKSSGDMTFVLDPSTHREGAIDVGSSVSVRYHEDGHSNLATAVTARPAKH